VLEAFTRHNRLWLVLAIVWHTVVDAVAVFAVPTWGVYVTEGLVVICGLLSVGVVLALRSPEEGEPCMEPGLLTGQPLLPHIEPGTEELDHDKLDKSRYFDGS
jgi:hypothetical protein